jgi:hypothetical protein
MRRRVRRRRGQPRSAVRSLVASESIKRATRSLLVAVTLFTLAACESGNRYATEPATPSAKPAISPADAEAQLQRIVLRAADIGGEYTRDVPRVQTNEQAAKARPDTAAALRQYEAWGQILAYNVQYGAPPGRDLVSSTKFARVMNTATLFEDADGASTALIAIRALPETLVENFLLNEAAGTKVSETQVTKGIGFPSAGDESFAWRVSGKATFADGFTTTFIADTVFVRAGSVTGAVTVVSLGQAPDRAGLERLVDRFIERARAP